MLLTQDQEMIRDAVRDFAQTELWPNAARWDKEHHFPKEAHQGLAALGAYGICVPEEFGGANLDYVTLALVLEEIAAGDGGTSTAISVTNCPVNAILMRYGNAQQKRDWLTPLARGEMLGAFCLTEPHVGSDASALRTTAVKQGDEYVINGVKQFITSGKNGHVAIVIAVTGRDFFQHQSEREVVEVGTAKLFGHADAVGAQRGQALVGLAWKVVFLVPARGIWPQLGLRKVAHRVADHFLVLGQQHRVSIQMCG